MGGKNRLSLNKKKAGRGKPPTLEYNKDGREKPPTLELKKKKWAGKAVSP
jgi:hypothetical protein